MDHPTRVEHFDGHEIRVFALSPLGAENTFRAKYEVRLNGHDGTKSSVGGIIVGPFSTAAIAEDAALKAAKLLIRRERKTP